MSSVVEQFTLAASVIPQLNPTIDLHACSSPGSNFWQGVHSSSHMKLVARLSARLFDRSCFCQTPCPTYPKSQKLVCHADACSGNITLHAYARLHAIAVCFLADRLAVPSFYQASTHTSSNTESPVMQAAQPALLYIVPAVLAAVGLHAAKRWEFNQV